MMMNTVSLNIKGKCQSYICMHGAKKRHPHAIHGTSFIPVTNYITNSLTN